MKSLPYILLISVLYLPALSEAANPATFWSDYPTCEDNCHQTVYNAQQCSLANSCSCAGCLCLADSCLCETSSWLIAVAQCIGEQCGSAAVTDAASIASSACTKNGYPLAVPSASLVSIGLAALSQTQTSAEVQATGTSFSIIAATASTVIESVAVPAVTATVVSTASTATVTASGSASKPAGSIASSVDAGSSTSSSSSATSNTAVQASNAPVSTSSSRLSDSAKIGIGIGIAAGAILFILLVGYILYQRQQHKKLLAITGASDSQATPKGPYELSGSGLGVSQAKIDNDSQVIEQKGGPVAVKPLSPTRYDAELPENQYFASATKALSPEEKQELVRRRRAAELSGTGRDIPIAPAVSERFELEARRRVFELA